MTSPPGSRFWEKRKLRQLGRPIKARSKAAGRGLPSMVYGNTWKSKDGYGTSLLFIRTASVLIPAWCRMTASTDNGGTTRRSPRAHAPYLCDHRSVRGTSASPWTSPAFHRSTRRTDTPPHPCLRKIVACSPRHACRAQSCWSSL